MSEEVRNETLTIETSLMRMQSTWKMPVEQLIQFHKFNIQTQHTCIDEAAQVEFSVYLLKGRVFFQM